MKPRFLVALLMLALAAPAGVATAAPAGHPHHRKPTARTVIRDCARDGRLSRRYSLTLLKRARRHLPADVRNYTNCNRVISRAIKREQRRRHRHHGHGRR